MSGRKLWSLGGERCLIEEVLKLEGVLFGDMKGCGTKSIHARRNEAWASIRDNLNAYTDCKREPEEIRKKYFNLKQRAKAKIDEIRRARQQTGGGPPPPSLTDAEDCLLQSMEGRPGIHGLESGVDTDERRAGNSASRKSSTNVRKRKSEGEAKSQEEATMENTLHDTERIILDKERLQQEIEMLSWKRLYYQLKIQSEFGINLTADEQ